MRIIIIAIGAIVVGTVAAAFAAGGDQRPADRSSVVAAFYPLAYAAEQEGEQPRSSSEIERYMALPGQSLSYKVGQLKIIELRRVAEKKLGAKFDVRAFHDQVLREGSLPLAVLESSMRAWLDRQ